MERNDEGKLIARSLGDIVEHLRGLADAVPDGKGGYELINAVTRNAYLQAAVVVSETKLILTYPTVGK